MPGEALGGLSFGPLSVVEKSTGTAPALDARPRVTNETMARPTEKALMGVLHIARIYVAPSPPDING
jgi:hypothetical protein